MKRPVEGYEFLAACRVTSKLQGRFNGFCPGVPKVDFLVPTPGRDFGKLLSQCRKLWVVEVGTGKMNELGGLILNRLNDPRMAMPCGADRYAGSKIQEGVSVHVGDHHAFGIGSDQWIGTAVRG
jgi:hypothetical protein